MNVFLDALAIKRSSPKLNSWKLKEPADASFIKLYPEIVMRKKRLGTILKPSYTVVIVLEVKEVGLGKGMLSQSLL